MLGLVLHFLTVVKKMHIHEIQPINTFANVLVQYELTVCSLLCSRSLELLHLT